MIDLDIDCLELVKWAREKEKVAPQVRPATAQALNNAGDKYLVKAAQAIAEDTGLDPEDIIDMIVEKQATPQDLTWEMDASGAVLQDATNWARPWQTGQDHTFEQGQLLAIVTTGDERVCHICAEAEAHSPYTIEEINNMAAQNAFYEALAGAGARTNLLHPNCRCHTVAWNQSKSSVSVFNQSSGSTRDLKLEDDVNEEIVKELSQLFEEKS